MTATCKTCDGLGEWEELVSGRHYTRQVICPDCEGRGWREAWSEDEIEEIERQQYEEEQRALENAEMEEHFRKHPHG